uniref:RT_RNaseH domain-containing protein n=1 Tax=Mesocestoides corti TaxID=53468 RepID=A0A5K3FJI9_MESCO
MLALKFFLEHYKHYLLGNEIVVRKDHQALRWLNNFKEPSGIIARWLEVLSQFNYKVEYRPGKKHENADALSRIPERTVDVAAISMEQTTVENWGAAQSEDPYISLIYDRQRTGSPKPTDKEMAGSSQEARVLWSAWNNLSFRDGVLYYKFGQVQIFIFPISKNIFER